MKISRISEKHSVLGGRAEIYRTSTAGDVWQFRLYDAAAKNHVRKSLKTRDLTAALEAAEALVLEYSGSKSHRAAKAQKRISAQHKVLDGLAVRRQNIWHNSRRRLAECRPRLGFDVKRRACGVASADTRWFVA